MLVSYMCGGSRVGSVVTGNALLRQVCVLACLTYPNLPAGVSAASWCPGCLGLSREGKVLRGILANLNSNSGIILIGRP